MRRTIGKRRRQSKECRTRATRRDRRYVSGVSLPPLITAMLQPAFYPQRPAAVTLAQTHISFVLLAGADVYKLKKPVRFSFLDFSTVDHRRHFCEEEVRLNRRLAPDVYRGVVAICRDAAGFRLGDAADPAAVDYAVHMRRLPDERTLEHLLEIHAVAPAMIDAVAQRLVDFHRQADAGPAVTANGDASAIARILDDNFTGVRPFRGVTVSPADDDAIQHFTRDFLATHAALFARRQAEHRIRDGHGDLHADHIYLTDPLVIIDCIEFNPLFRYCDVASDLAFLVMDLEYHDAPALARHLVARYAALSGDTELPQLVPFYACYRAYVRGKVDSLKSAEEEVDPADRAAARTSAARHFALAYRYTWSARPGVVVIAGLSGTGKSTVATALQHRTGYVHLVTDVIRKELAGLPPTARGGAETGLYTPEHSIRTYDEMFRQAEAALAADRGVILDATFQLRAGRRTARALAERYGVPFALAECRCDETVVHERLAQRDRHGRDASDADWAVYLEQRRRCEPFDEPDRLVLDTTRPTGELVARIEAALRAIA
jgi:hypothetical protein